MIEGYLHDETETSMTGDPIDQGWLMNLMMVLMAKWGKLKPVGSPWFSHCMSKSPVRDFVFFVCLLLFNQHVRFPKLPSRLNDFNRSKSRPQMDGFPWKWRIYRESFRFCLVVLNIFDSMNWFKEKHVQKSMISCGFSLSNECLGLGYWTNLPANFQVLFGDHQLMKILTGW